MYIQSITISFGPTQYGDSFTVHGDHIPTINVLSISLQQHNNDLSLLMYRSFLNRYKLMMVSLHNTSIIAMDILTGHNLMDPKSSDFYLLEV